MNPPPRIELDRTTLGALAALAAVFAVGAAATLWGLSGWTPVILQLFAAVVAGAMLVGRALRRRRAHEALKDQARALITSDLAVQSLAASQALPRRHVDDWPQDLRDLSQSLDELGQRLGGQMKEVAKKTRNLEALISAMDEPLLATDSEERVLLCNASAEAIFGTDDEPGGLRGRAISELFTHSTLLEMHAAARAGQVRRLRVPLVTALGKRVFQVSASPVPLAWGKGVFGAVMVLRDVTELDQAVQVKTDFVANASHELRTPVSAIRGAAETLAGGVMQDDPAMAERLTRMIVNHAGRLEELLRDLLDLSRLESPDVPLAIERIDVDDVASSLEHMFEGACGERNLRLVFDIDEALNESGGFFADRRLLMLIVRNLVENATKFAFEGSEVRIGVTLIEAEIPGPSGGDLSTGGMATDARAGSRGVVRWEVADRGIGIPLNQQDRVFERFYQVDAARTGSGKRGTGLGLAIVKHAAKAMGGRVGLKSVWGQGTTVWAELPVRLGDADAASERRAG